MKNIAVGATSTRRITIDKPRTVDFLGEALRVYATPELVRDIEVSCREFLLAYADAGEDSVGIGINISHSGATLVGMQVDITITVTAVEGRKVSFSVVAKDDAEEIMDDVLEKGKKALKDKKEQFDAAIEAGKETMSDARKKLKEAL